MCAESSDKEAVATGRSHTVDIFLTKSRTEKRSKFMISEAFGAIGDAFGRKSHAPKRPKMRHLCAIRALRLFATTKNRKFLIAVFGP